MGAIEIGTERTTRAIGRDVCSAAREARDHGTVTKLAVDGRQVAAIVPLDDQGYPVGLGPVAESTEDYGDECVIQLASGRTIRTDTYESSEAGSSYVRVCDADGTELGYWTSDEWAEDPQLVMGAFLGMAYAGPAS